MYFRVYSHCLDYNKNWYAYNDLLFGYPKSGRKHEGNTTFRLFSSEVQKVNIADLIDRDGKQPSHTWFNGKVQKAKEVYAITSFGIFLLALRQQQPSQEWMQSTAYQNIKNIVNTVCLEQLDDNVNDDGLDHARNVEPSPKRARLERQIRLLKEKNDEQETVILSVRAHECLNKIDKSLRLSDKPLCCGGIRSSDSRQFSNGLPWVLPIFLGDLGQTDKLSGPDEIPRHLQILDTTYTLGGVTFWNGVHYKGRLQYHGRGYDYDGMHGVPLKEIKDVSAPSPVGFIIASIVYFKE